jgi:hypothetical protein
MDDEARPLAPSAGGTDAANASSSSSSCLACRQHPIEYRCWPCGCATLCVSCARKMATGGRCKLCKELFAEMKRV